MLHDRRAARDHRPSCLARPEQARAALERERAELEDQLDRVETALTALGGMAALSRGRKAGRVRRDFAHGDLAVRRLSAGPGGGGCARSAEGAPRATGPGGRVGLWQLFPLLVPAVLFGGASGGPAARIARRYAG